MVRIMEWLVLDRTFKSPSFRWNIFHQIELLKFIMFLLISLVTVFLKYTLKPCMGPRIQLQTFIYLNNLFFPILKQGTTHALAILYHYARITFINLPFKVLPIACLFRIQKWNFFSITLQLDGFFYLCCPTSIF